MPLQFLHPSNKLRLPIWQRTCLEKILYQMYTTIVHWKIIWVHASNKRVPVMYAAIYTIIVYLLTTVLFTCKFTILKHLSKNHSVTVTGTHRWSIIVYQSRHINDSLIPADENLYRVTVRENLSTRRVYSISTKKCFDVRTCEHFE